MIVLALDPSLTTGWATNAADRYHRGTAGFVKIDALVKEWFGGPFEAPQDKLARRLATAQRWLGQLADYVRPDLFVIERQLSMRGKSRMVNHDIEAVFMGCAGDRDALLLNPAPATWQAHAKKNGWGKLPDPEGAIADAQAMLSWAQATYPAWEAA